MRVFGKTVKNLHSIGAPPSNPRLPPAAPRVVTSAYYYSYVEFISSAKSILLAS